MPKTSPLDSISRCAIALVVSIGAAAGCTPGSQEGTGPEGDGRADETGAAPGRTEPCEPVHNTSVNTAIERVAISEATAYGDNAPVTGHQNYFQYPIEDVDWDVLEPRVEVWPAPSARSVRACGYVRMNAETTVEPVCVVGEPSLVMDADRNPLHGCCSEASEASMGNQLLQMTAIDPRGFENDTGTLFLNIKLGTVNIVDGEITNEQCGTVEWLVTGSQGS